MRSDADRLGDVIEAIAKIRERITDGIDPFLDDEMLQVWVIHHLQVVGEAARGVSQSLNGIVGTGYAIPNSGTAQDLAVHGKIIRNCVACPRNTRNAKNSTVFVRLPYSETLYLFSTGGKKYER